MAKQNTSASNDLIFALAMGAIGHYAKALGKLQKKVIRDHDENSIHQFRVYSRKLRSALAFFDFCIPTEQAYLWKAALKSVSKSLNNTRDLDVFLNYIETVSEEKISVSSRNAIGYLREVILVKKIKNSKKIFYSIAFFEKSKVLKNICVLCANKHSAPFTPNEFNKTPLNELSKRMLGVQLKRLKKNAVHLVNAEKVEELHTCRIIVKKIKYFTEIILPFYKGLAIPYNEAKILQEILGEIHDCDMWIQYLHSFENRVNPQAIKRGITSLILKRQKERSVLHKKMLTIMVKTDARKLESNIWKAII